MRTREHREALQKARCNKGCFSHPTLLSRSSEAKPYISLHLRPKTRASVAVNCCNSVNVWLQSQLCTLQSATRLCSRWPGCVGCVVGRLTRGCAVEVVYVEVKGLRACRVRAQHAPHVRVSVDKTVVVDAQLGRRVRLVRPAESVAAKHRTRADWRCQDKQTWSCR